MKNRIKYILIILIAVILDQVTKVLVINGLHAYQSVPIIGHFLFITLVYNTGGAFSIFSNQTFFLAFVSIIALLYLMMNMRIEKKNNILKSILCAGIIGNLIDRMFRKSVVDYIGIYILKHQFPIFNLADIYIVITIIILLIYNIKEVSCKK